MTHMIGTFSGVAPFDARVLRQGNSRRIILGAVVVGFGTVAAAWVIAASLTVAAAWVIAASLTINSSIQENAPPNPRIQENPPAAPKIALANPYGTLAPPTNLFRLVPILTDPGYAFDANVEAEPSPPAAAAPPPPKPRPEPMQSAPLPPPSRLEPMRSAPLPPLQPRPEPVRSAPLPSPNPFFRPEIQVKLGNARPSVRPTGLRIAAPQEPAINAPAPDTRNPFQKFFDAMKQPPSPALAYARPEAGAVGGLRGYGNSLASPALDGTRTAIYDIAAHTVYLPDGERLEAHSGLGARLDDPRYVNEKDRGATPPHVYDLSLRGQLFHGVPALRLNPVGGGAMYNRTGLLAHTYMLGPRGDSNGCVSFRDYRRFLQAYSSGQVQRLVVVAHLGAAPSRPAFARRIDGHRYASN